MFKLIIQDDEGKTTVVPLIRDEITIGRKEGNTIRLTERNVSRKHARIIRSNGSVLIEDLESYNGVKINGARIQGRVPVAETDRIQIGDYLLELKTDRAAASSDPFGEQRTVPLERADTAAPLGVAPTAPLPAQPMPPLADAAPLTAESTAVVGPAQMQALAARRSKQHVVDDATTLTDTPAVPAGPAGPSVDPDKVPRVVVVSQNFAGTEFRLDKPVMVIGRTEDNDIVINHRSISRHHAKLVQELGRWAIIDLESSNGVRVNGEDYSKVELRKGDMIDLGHVRLRFIEAGEDFVFERDARVVVTGDGAGGKSNRGFMLGAAGVVVVAAIAVVFVVSKKGNADGEVKAKVAAATTPDGNGGTAPADDVVPKPVPDPPVPTPTPGVATQLAEAQTAVEEERWDDAAKAAADALAVEPGNAEAARLAAQAEAEAKNKGLYEDFAKVAAGGDFAASRKKLLAIPEDSFYRAKASGELDALRVAWVDKQVAEATAAAKAGKCARKDAIARKVAEHAPEDKARIDGIECSAGAIAVKTPDSTVKTPPPDNTVKTPPPTGQATFESLLGEAKQAALNGNYGRALDKAEGALALKPGDLEATMMAGFASCRQKNGDKAQKYLAKLKGQRYALVRQECLKVGIQF